MKRKRYTEEQIISILKEHEAGAHRWRIWPGATVWRRIRSTVGSQSSAAWRFPRTLTHAVHDMKAENAKLKRLLGEAELDKAALKELVEENW